VRTAKVRLIARCRTLYAGEELHEELNRTVFALDSTVIELCLALFPWAPNKKGHAAIKLHTLLVAIPVQAEQDSGVKANSIPG
jgi:hypothetical protein